MTGSTTRDAGPGPRFSWAGAVVLSALLSAGSALAGEQSRTLPPFDAVSNSGPINITVVAGQAQSVVARGNATFLARLDTEVVDGELRVSLSDKSLHGELGDPRVIVTLPTLARFRMAGVGTSTLSNLGGPRLDIRFAGAGVLRAEGQVESLTLSADGVGSVDARGLRAGSVTAKVSGIGRVTVFATARLDGRVDGVGSLTYYGEPPDVRTAGAGLGRIARGR